VAKPDSSEVGLGAPLTRDNSAVIEPPVGAAASGSRAAGQGLGSPWSRWTTRRPSPRLYGRQTLPLDELQEPRDLLGARLLVVQSGSGMGGDDHFG
jgi:hypothetical protein